jgi:hypothetical protein
MPNLNVAQFSILQLAFASIFAGIIYFFVLFLFYNSALTKVYFRKIFAKNKFNTYTITALAAITIFIYQKPLYSLITDPPPFAFLIAFVLFILTNYQNQNKTIIEVQNMFTATQTSELKNTFNEKIHELEVKFTNFETKFTNFETKFTKLEQQGEENARLLRQIANVLNINNQIQP